MADCTTLAAPDICPTREQVYDTSIALLPSGLGWQTDTANIPRDGSVLKQFWYAIADVFHYLEERICAALLEFSCSTATETRDAWECDYGIPDECGWWSDVCAKVAAIGGGDCDYFSAVAEANGFKIECMTSEAYRAPQVGCATTGCVVAGASPKRSQIYIKIITSESPAYQNAQLPLAGRALAGASTLCEANMNWLECVFLKIIPAHVELIFEVA